MRFGRSLADTLARARQMGVAQEHHMVVHRPAQLMKNPKARCGCGRTQQADMMMRVHGDYVCDGCHRRMRKAGLLG